MKLADRALLVYLSISQFNPKRDDKKATKTVEASHATAKGSVTANKYLISDCAELKAIKYAEGQLRTFLRQETLPWMSDGARIINSLHVTDFLAEIGVLKQDYDRAVDSFLREYPNLKNAQRTKLGDLFNEHEYPSVDELRLKYGVKVSVHPLPVDGDFRTDVPDVLKDAHIQEMQDVLTNAMRDLWAQLFEPVKHAAEKLAETDATFRDSTLTKLNETCARVRKLNIADNPAVNSACSEIEALSSKISPDVCRDNVNEREKHAKALAEIADKLSIWKE
jgi:hypothetical protein